MTIRWLRSAQRDMALLSGYIARDNPCAAADVELAIRALALHLTQFPEIGVRGEIAGTRQLYVQPYPYVIVYRATPPDHIEILRILHTSQQWP